MRAAVDRLARADLDHVTLRAEAATMLRRHLGHDIAVWATVDPVTVMWTHCVLDGAVRDHELERRIFRNEFGGRDVCALTELLAAPVHAGSIDRATGGDPRRSERYTEAVEPLGMRDELRVVLADGGTPWGAVHLLRGDRPFTAAETAAAGELAGPMAAALRRSLVRTAAVDPSRLDDPPGVIEIEPDGSIGTLSPEAEHLLAGVGRADLPQVIDAVVAQRGSGAPGTASVPGPEGIWLTFMATTVGDAPAVIVEPARPRRLAEIIVRTYGLTARERDVLELVARGCSTAAIAHRLSISERTVQDHLKAVFAKLGVSTRAEAVAAVFFGHYLPMHDAGATPSPRGWYLR